MALDTTADQGNAGRPGERVPAPALARAGRWLGGERLRLMLPFASLLGLIVVFTVTAPAFLTLANLAIIGRQSSILLVIAAGATLVVVAGSVDLSVGAVATLVGTLGALLVVHDHPNLVWALVLLGVVCGALNGVLVAYVKLPSFLVTLGTLFIFGGIASKVVGGSAVSAVQDQLFTAINDSPLFGIPNSIYWAAATIAVVSFVAYRTTFGRHVFAIGGNERVAELSGLPVRRDKVLLFTLSGALAAIAGLMLLGRQGGSSPNMGDAFLLQAVAAIVMGGTPLTGGAGGPLRTILGVLTIVVLSDGLTLSSVDPYYVNVVFGVVVILAVVFTTRRGEVEAVK